MFQKHTQIFFVPPFFCVQKANLRIPSVTFATKQTMSYGMWLSRSWSVFLLRFFPVYGFLKSRKHGCRGDNRHVSLVEQEKRICEDAVTLIPNICHDTANFVLTRPRKVVSHHYGAIGQTENCGSLRKHNVKGVPERQIVHLIFRSISLGSVI